MITILANEEGVEFINNDKKFRYRDDIIDEQILLPCDQLHLTNDGITHLLNNLRLSEMAESKLVNGPTNRWQHGQGISKTLSQTPRKPPTKPISTFPPQRHLRHPTSLRQQQQLSRNAHQSSTQHAPPPPPPPPPRHHTSSPQVSQPTSSSFAERQHGQGGGDRPWIPTAKLRPPHRFRGGNVVLSNFYSYRITVYGIWYPTSEHAYKHRKAEEMNDIELAHLILPSISPQGAKYYGSQVKTDDYWHNIKQFLMYEILEEK